MVFVSQCGFGLIHTSIVFYMFQLVNYLEFPGRLWHFLITLALALGSFLIFYLKSSSLTNSSGWMQMSDYSQPARISMTKLSQVKAVVFKQGQGRLEDPEDIYLSLDVPLDPTPRYLTNRFYFINSQISVTSPNQYYLIKSRNQDQKVLQCIIKQRVRWSFQIEMRWPHNEKSYSSNVWLDNERLENRVFILKNFQDKVEILDVKRRKSVLKLDFERCSNEFTKMMQTKVLGFWIKSKKNLAKFRYCMAGVSYYGQRINIWAQREENLNRLDFLFFVDLKKSFWVSEVYLRSSFPTEEVYPFDNLIAMKSMWVDRNHNERTVLNMAKFQRIVVVEIDEEAGEVKEITDLSEITEGMFSASKIDSLFFLDKETLGVVMSGRLLMIDWKAVEIRRCIEIEGLPQVRDEARWALGCFNYWYDREKERVMFRAGAVGRLIDESERDWFGLVISLISGG